MKNYYNIKEKVWIHIGEQSLVEGRVVEIIDLEHLNEGHDKNHELYIIEIPSSIEPVYEVRTFEQTSPDSTGPLILFRNLGEDVTTGNRALRKIGVKLPESALANVQPAPNPKFKKRYYKKKR